MEKNSENIPQIHEEDILMSIKTEPETINEREDNANSTSDENELDESWKSTSKEAINYMFVKSIDSLGRILLSKSNAPQILEQKRQAAKKVSKYLMLKGRSQFKPEQIPKKISNLKQKVKLKTDMEMRGEEVKIRPSEKLFLELLKAENNINNSSSKTLDGLEGNDSLFMYSTDEEQLTSSCTVSVLSKVNHISKKRKMSNENHEDRDIKSLQKEVLREQLELIRMEKEMKEEAHKKTMKKIQLEMKQKEIKHMVEMQILHLKKHIVEAELNSD